MPQDEAFFWNPYRLIPARDSVERSSVWTDERFRGHSGIIRCAIENLTPLFVGAQSQGNTHPPLLRENRRVIPGSSLKGMLRSLAEIVGGGCFVVNDPKSRVPGQMSRCQKIDRLCIACRMFGAMERGSPAKVHKGKVSIGDAIVREQTLREKSFEVLLANNGIRHSAFYSSPHTGDLDGQSRKLYFHQPSRRESVLPVPESIRNHAWQINALLAGHHFDFAVQFTSLTDDELCLLLYILHLEDQVEVVIGEERIKLKGPMRHKIGNAKPLGMGSCHILLSTLTYFAPPKERFTTMNPASSLVLEAEDLKREIQDRTKGLVNDQSPTMAALRKMMVWDESDKRDFHYPPYGWFKNPANRQTPLKAL